MTGIRTAPDLVAHVSANSGACHLVVHDVVDVAAATAGMRAARSAILRLRHPEEPEEQLLSFASEVVSTAHGPTFWFDVADIEAYDGYADLLVAVLVATLEAAGVDGVLAPGEPPRVGTPEGTHGVSPTLTRSNVVDVEDPDVALLERLLFIAQYPAPERRNYQEVCRFRNGQLVRRSEGHFIFDVESAGDLVLVTEITRNSEERFTRLWRFHDGQVAPLPGLGNPACGSFGLSPSEHLAYSEYDPERVERNDRSFIGSMTTILSVRWSDDPMLHTVASGTVGHDYGFDEGDYLFSPQVHDDRTIAFLRGTPNQAAIHMTSPVGEETVIDPPTDVRFERILTNQSTHLAIDWVSRQPGLRSFGILDLELAQLSLAEPFLQDSVDAWNPVGWVADPSRLLLLRRDNRRQTTSVGWLDPADWPRVHIAGEIPALVTDATEWTSG